MKINSKVQLHGLNHLRTVAIVIVFLYHYKYTASISIFNRIANFGWSGVDLFFVLSGYLIGSQLLNQLKKENKILITEFYVKRFFRIIPAYLIILFCYFQIPIFRENGELPPLWRFLTFTQNFGLDILHQGSFSNAWSLCVEEHFYLLLPIILILVTFLKLNNKVWLLIILIFIGGMMGRAYSFNHFLDLKSSNDIQSLQYFKWIHFPTYTRLDGLLTGVGLAAIFVFKVELSEKIKKYGNIWLILGLFLLLVSYIMCENLKNYYAAVYGYPLISFGYGFCVLAALSPNCFLYSVKSKITNFIASLAYSIYLTHGPVIHIITLIFKSYKIQFHNPLHFICCVISTIVIAWLLCTVIEKSFLRLRVYLLENKLSLSKMIKI